MDAPASAAQTRSVDRPGFWVLLGASGPSFMLQLDVSIVSVSLPSIAHTLGASFAGIEWVVSAYVLSFASWLLPSGALADRFGRKRVLLVGLSIFTLASALCGLAPSLAILIAARALEGIGAAMLLSSSLATLSHAFQGEARTRAFSFWGAVVGLGLAAGPVVGGLITQTFGWQWAFQVNVPIGVALIAMVWRVLETSKDPHALRLDLPGVVCFGGALFLTTLALIEGNRRGWTDKWILGELAAALALFVLFTLVELKEARPMLDLAYLRRRTFMGANLAQLSYAVGLMAMLTFLPIYLERGLGYGAAIAGVMMLPMVAPLFVIPPIVTHQLAHRFSGRGLLTLGLCLVCGGLFWLSLAARQAAYGPLVGGMLLTGAGAGLLNGESTKVGMTVIPRERAGMASGVAGTVRFAGLVLGIAALGAALYSRVSAGVAHALPWLPDADRLALVRQITTGDFSGVALAGRTPASLRALAKDTFASGYQALFLDAAVFTLISTVLTWWLVRSSETPPVPAPARVRPRPASR